MEMLGAIFTVGIVVTGAFMIWLRTKIWQEMAC